MTEVTINDEDIDQLVAEYNSQLNDVNKHWYFDERRRHLFKTWDDVQACPGSGKTTLVAAKLLILAKKWKDKHQGICVLTHTNVARDEVISKLINHPSGHKLTTYPHFIGTIQEFINKFLATPYSKSRGWNLTQLSAEEFALHFSKIRWKKFISKSTGRNYWFSYYVNSKKIQIKNLYFEFIDGELSISKRFMKEVDSQLDLEKSNTSARYFETKKIEYTSLGICQYQDAYAFAEKLILDNDKLINSLRKRFPVVLIDEMQDTQKYQDTLINNIFDSTDVYLQRFGDPDQAIFDGIGGGEPNESYNGKDGLYEITTTHRFQNDICEKIIGLSYNGIDQLTNNDTEREDDICNHTVFLYNDQTQSNVLEAFGKLVAESDPEMCWNTVKAVGGVDGQGGYIQKYWGKFDKNKSAKSPKPKKLIHIVRLCQTQVKGHVSSNYNLLLQGVVDLLRKANLQVENNIGKRVYFSKQSITYRLKAQGKYHSFNKLLTHWMLSDNIDADNWKEQLDSLQKIIECDFPVGNEDVEEYLDFDADLPDADDGEITVTNKYICENGCEIEVATIHSVKGETHDATLVLETKYHQNDLQQILPNLVDVSKSSPRAVRKKEFMRKLYVASSRPRKLLCMALHKDNITDDQIAALEELCWSVEVLGNEV